MKLGTLSIILVVLFWTIGLAVISYKIYDSIEKYLILNQVNMGDVLNGNL